VLLVPRNLGTAILESWERVEHVDAETVDYLTDDLTSFLQALLKDEA
jgi:putative hydrolase of the HAD superfamily